MLIEDVTDSGKEIEARLNAARKRRTTIAAVFTTLFLLVLGITVGWLIAGIQLDVWGIALIIIGTLFSFSRASNNRMFPVRMHQMLRSFNPQMRDKVLSEMSNDGEMFNLWVIGGSSQRD